MTWNPDRAIRGRTLFLITIIVLMSNEFLGMCVVAVDDGSFTIRQATGFMVVEFGTLFIYMGESGARRIVGLALLGVATWGAWHLARFPHTVSVHSVLLATQSSVRGVGALILLASRAVAEYVLRLGPVGGRRRRGAK